MTLLLRTLGLAAALYCGASGLPAADAADLRIAFALNGKVDGASAPYLVPFDKGYYKAEGLNVGIENDIDSAAAIARVATGAADIGVADINALIRYRDTNPAAPVKAVFVVQDRPAFAIVGRKSRGISGPKSLEGRRLGLAAGGASAAYWPIFAKTAGIDTAKVAIETIGVPVREPMLAAGQVDAVTGSSLIVSVGLKERGVPAEDIAVLPMANHGVELYGDVIIVNTRFATAQPEAVRGVLRAFIKGLRDSAKSPQSAIASVVRRNDSLNKDVETERLALALHDHVLTPGVVSKGYGAIDPARLARAIDQLAIAFPFKNGKPAPTDVFDPSFLPDDSERRTN